MHVDGPIPLVLLDLEKALRHRGARVVDEHVDRLVPLERFADDLLRPSMVRHVGDEAARHDAVLREPLHGRLELSLQHVDQDEREAPPSDRVGAALPDAARRAGHHRHRSMFPLFIHGVLLIVQR